MQNADVMLFGSEVGAISRGFADTDPAATAQAPRDDALVDKSPLEMFGDNVFDPEGLCCEVAIIDPAIEASGLADEYDLPTQTMRGLAVNANALITVAMCAPTDEEFIAMLNSFRAPPLIEEMGFLFGYAEYVRQQLLEALASSGRAEEIRQLLRRRIELAHAKCRQVVLQS